MIHYKNNFLFDEKMKLKEVINLPDLEKKAAGNAIPGTESEILLPFVN